MNCRLRGCEDPATHEYRREDGTKWRPACEDHAEEAYSLGHDVRKLDAGEAER